MSEQKDERRENCIYLRGSRIELEMKRKIANKKHFISARFVIRLRFHCDRQVTSFAKRQTSKCR